MSDDTQQKLLFDLPEDLPQEVREAIDRVSTSMPSETPYTRLHDALQAAGESPRAQELSRLLGRLLTFERDGADLISTPYAATMGLHRMARATLDMLGDWLPAEPQPQQAQKVITVEAAEESERE